MHAHTHTCTHTCTHTHTHACTHTHTHTHTHLLSLSPFSLPLPPSRVLALSCLSFSQAHRHTTAHHPPTHLRASHELAAAAPRLPQVRASHLLGWSETTRFRQHMPAWETKTTLNPSGTSSKWERAKHGGQGRAEKCASNPANQLLICGSTNDWLICGIPQIMCGMRRAR